MIVASLLYPLPLSRERANPYLLKIGIREFGPLKMRVIPPVVTPCLTYPTCTRIYTFRVPDLPYVALSTSLPTTAATTSCKEWGLEVGQRLLHKQPQDKCREERTWDERDEQEHKAIE